MTSVFISTLKWNNLSTYVFLIPTKKCIGTLGSNFLCFEGKIKRVNIKIHPNYFSLLILFRDYPWPNGNILRKTQAAGKQCSFPSLPPKIPIPIPPLPQIFQQKPLILWRTSDLELSMTSLPKPKTSLAGRSCPKYSISSTKELVSVAMYLLKDSPCLYLKTLITKSWIVLKEIVGTRNSLQIKLKTQLFSYGWSVFDCTFILHISDFFDRKFTSTFYSSNLLFTVIDLVNEINQGLRYVKYFNCTFLLVVTFSTDKNTDKFDQ